MNFLNKNLLFVMCIVACLLHYSSAQESAPAVKRIALRRPTNVGKGLKAGGPSTTTTVPPPLPAGEGEEDYQEGEGAGAPQYGEGEENLEGVEALSSTSTTTTTTETPKRIGPVIRPFRSNDDFLNSLKRRQMNAKKNKLEKVGTSKSSKALQDSQETAETAPVPAPAANGNSKTFSKSNASGNRRKFNKSSKTADEEETANEETETEQKDEQKARRTTSRLPNRKRN